MSAFREVLSTCELHDLGFVGLPYTYDNNQQGDRNVKVHLDQVIADDNWRDLFSGAQVSHLTGATSDHCPLLVSLVQEENRSRGRNTLKYEIMWERDPLLPEVIAKAWDKRGNIDNLGDINTALNRVHKDLKKWRSENFGAVTKQIEEQRTHLNNICSLGNNADPQALREALDKMNELLYREEMMWLQRSRINWLREGDCNTKYFHRRAVWRARKNYIKRLKDENGRWITNRDDMHELANEFFDKLYDRDPGVVPSLVLQHVPCIITEEINGFLCAEFSEKEISDALFQIGPLKAPGPDGLPGRFFQRNSDIMKNDIIGAVKQFFSTAYMPEGVNDTSIVLIPNKPQPVSLKDYRPISLCNVIYKVVSKCLVNRLRPWLNG